MAIAKCGDINLEYYDEGEGPPLLMIRGLGAQCTTWGEPFLAPLRERFRVIRFSNRGTGLSDKPPGPVSVKMLADDGVALLDTLGIERAHVFGVSLGGMIAQELVLNHPQRVDRLVLGCTFCGGERGVRAEAEVLALLTPTPDITAEEMIRRARPTLITERTMREKEAFLEKMLRLDIETPTPAETVVNQMAAVGEFDTYERLASIEAPTMVLHGDSDVLIPTENARILHERIPGSMLEIMPEAGHMFFWDHPEQTAEVLASFLMQVPAGRE